MIGEVTTTYVLGDFLPRVCAGFKDVSLLSGGERERLRLVCVELLSLSGSGLGNER